MNKSKPQYTDAKERNGKSVKSKQSFRSHIYTFTHITWRWSSHCRWVEIAALLILGVFSVLEMVTNQAVRIEKHSTHEASERCSRHLFPSCRCEMERHRRGFAIEIVGWKLDVFSYHYSGSFAVQIGKSWERTFKIMRTRNRRPRLWSPCSDIWIIKTRLSKSLISQHWQSESQTRFQSCE